MSLLFEAIRNKNYEEMEVLLQKGEDMNAADEEGMTPRMAATKVNRPDMS